MWQSLIITTNDQTGSKSLSRISSKEITRELDKKSLLNCYSIYISYNWFMLILSNLALKSMYLPCICYKASWDKYAVAIHYDIFPSSSFYLNLDIWCYHYVTAVICLFIVQKKKRKENIRQVKRKTLKKIYKILKK